MMSRDQLISFRTIDDEYDEVASENKLMQNLDEFFIIQRKIRVRRMIATRGRVAPLLLDLT